MKQLLEFWRRLMGAPTRRSDILPELAEAYYLASEIEIKAQQTNRRIDRLCEQEEREGA